jgi:hypothetical protein
MTRLSNHRLQCDRCRTLSMQFIGRNTKDWIEQVHDARWRAVPITRNGVTAYEHRCPVCEPELSDTAEGRISRRGNPC